MILKKFEELLLIYYPTELDDLQKGLENMKDPYSTSTSEGQDLIFQKCIINVIQCFGYEFGNNIALYVGQIISLSSPYRQVGLRIAQMLWHSSLREERNAHSLNGLRNLLRSLPFIKSSDSITEELLLQCFDGPNNQQVKTMDVASQGKMEPMPELEIAKGSLRTTWSWLSNEMGISPSNRLFSLGV